MTDFTVQSTIDPGYVLVARGWPDGTVQFSISGAGNIVAVQVERPDVFKLADWLDPDGTIGVPRAEAVVPKDNQTILEEAQKIVHGPRRASYGTPQKNFERIAGLWQAYLDGRNDGAGDLNATDVAMLMILLKVARIQHRPDRDGLVDITGYAACAAIINDIDPS